MPSKNNNNRNQEINIIPCDNEDDSIHDVKENDKEQLFSDPVPGCNVIQILMAASSTNTAVAAYFVQNEATLVEKRVRAFDRLMKFRQVENSSHLASGMLLSQVRKDDDSVEGRSKRSVHDDNNSSEPSLKRRLLHSRWEDASPEIMNPVDPGSSNPSVKVMKKHENVFRVTNKSMSFQEAEAVRESILIQANRLKRMAILMRHLECVQNKLVQECLCIRKAQQI